MNKFASTSKKSLNLTALLSFRAFYLCFPCSLVNGGGEIQIKVLYKSYQVAFLALKSW